MNLAEQLAHHNAAVNAAAVVVDAARAAHDPMAEAAAVAALHAADRDRKAFLRYFREANSDDRGSSFWRRGT